MSQKKKYPDNIVFNEETETFDANIKPYPTTVGSQKFDIIEIDKGDSIKADKFFKQRLDEITKQYNELLESYESTKLVYETKFSFQPDLGVMYHMYLNKDGNTFLSIINPDEWDREYVGSYVLGSNGVWDKVTYMGGINYGNT